MANIDPKDLEAAYMEASRGGELEPDVVMIQCPTCGRGYMLLRDRNELCDNEVCDCLREALDKRG